MQNRQFSFFLVLCLLVCNSFAFDFFDMFEKAANQEYGRGGKEQETEADQKRNYAPYLYASI